jgi:segregation and condensation protein B
MECSVTETLAQLEALLLVAGETATVETLARALSLSVEQVEAGLRDLDDHYTRHGHGARVLRQGDRAQLTTAPEHSAVVASFLGAPQGVKLSPAAWETLAIVAYRQPVSRPEIESIRGVNSDYTMRLLLEHGLIEERGRADTPGRATVYGTTVEFLKATGLRSLDELPPLSGDALTP